MNAVEIYNRMMDLIFNCLKVVSIDELKQIVKSQCGVDDVAFNFDASINYSCSMNNNTFTAQTDDTLVNADGDHSIEFTAFHDLLHLIQGSSLDVVLTGFVVHQNVVIGGTPAIGGSD